ncbi:hypothetical protein [Azotobacter vinelandii]|uniref:hypothetical protein n=1 Tax=Azotobacter vinelandii TaxID=354 RepID=UPI002665C066|nr:hypothetical protein [Azotobacter vinelandii]WKN21519.1 hypothetical protein AVAEIV_004619 [Azotobacter vinelandii]
MSITISSPVLVEAIHKHIEGFRSAQRRGDTALAIGDMAAMRKAGEEKNKHARAIAIAMDMSLEQAAMREAAGQ